MASLIASPCYAVEYDVFVDVDDVDELADLRDNGDIGVDDFAALNELLAAGVDLDRAGREEIHALPNVSHAQADAMVRWRAAAGGTVDLRALVADGVLSAAEADALAPFLLTRAATGPRRLRGRGRLRTLAVVGDPDPVPSTAADARLDWDRRLRIGAVAVVVRRDLRDVRYDAMRDALSARAPRTRLAFPKAFVFWHDDALAAAAGTYRIGFGERLVFDDTGRERPYGIVPDDAVSFANETVLYCRETAGELTVSPCAGAAGNRYTAPDVTWRQGLRGAAVGLSDVAMGRARLSVWGWGSLADHDLGQYAIVDRRACPDPRAGDASVCYAPRVVRRRADPLAPTSHFAYATLPAMVNEGLGGVHLRVRTGRGFVSATGYGARNTWLVRGAALDFQEWAGMPRGRNFGAAGVGAGFARGWYDAAMELARSFDADPSGGGGHGAVWRQTASWRAQELESVVRLYDRQYGNPHGRPVAADDEAAGFRARDEVGARTRYRGRLGDWRVRATVDVWSPVTRALANVAAAAAADVQLFSWWWPGAGFDVASRTFAPSDGGDCAATATAVEEPSGEPAACRGERGGAVVRSRLAPLQNVTIHASYRQAWIDDPRDAARDRRDQAAAAAATWDVAHGWRLRLRVRFADQDVVARDRGARTLWSGIRAAGMPLPWLGLSASYDNRLWRDTRTATAARVPRQEHWLGLDVRGSY